MESMSSGRLPGLKDRGSGQGQLWKQGRSHRLFAVKLADLVFIVNQLIDGEGRLFGAANVATATRGMVTMRFIETRRLRPLIIQHSLRAFGRGMARDGRSPSRLS
ncbi:hypothetical protein C7271_21000 [filamentous cyanobacterium CCP5]|nr:hypothetical protein C7271_21000 [filamentous cyanobacterium CCP5]